MKQIYIFLVTALSFSLAVSAQTEVTIDGSATWIGFANVFETPANGGGFVFNSGWAVEDIKSTIGSDDTVTLQPNFNTYADNPTDPFWVDQTTLEAAKVELNDNSKIEACEEFFSSIDIIDVKVDSM